MTDAPGFSPRESTAPKSAMIANKIIHPSISLLLGEVRQKSGGRLRTIPDLLYLESMSRAQAVEPAAYNAKFAT
jgi:hypothetical protein